ncbi:hypothetical protein [Streptomyces sp. NPDC093589]|uniref:hypothetical protein n=1 Tax=Streptomyces sp. NPDC093589 TaxID=3366043 RepID=UPI0037FE47DD
MGNRADAEGADVVIYRKPLTETIHADTPTGAPEQLLALLDRLGLERKTVTTAGPVYVWHEVPDHLDPDEQTQLATRPIPALLMAGYVVHIPDDLFDPDAYREAVHDVRTARPAPTAAPVAPAPPGPAARSRQRRTG